MLEEERNSNELNSSEDSQTRSINTRKSARQVQTTATASNNKDTNNNNNGIPGKSKLV